MLSRFYIHVLDEDADYVRAHDKAITDHMTKQLLLLLQSMRDADLRKEKVAGRGISGDASVETANKREELQRAHDAAFPNNEELLRQMERDRKQGGMVLPKGF